MILNKEQDLDFMKKTATKLFAAVVVNDYGDEGLNNLIQITSCASNIYKYIPLDENYELIFYKSFDSSHSIQQKYPNNYVEVTDFAVLASNSSTKFIIEVINENTAHILVNGDIEINALTPNSVVYTFIKGNETVYGKSHPVSLDSASGVVSYFAMPTFKQLDGALEHYKTHIARRSNCPEIKVAWFSENKIFMKPAPEERLRKSLYAFLSWAVRGEVKEEQNVDDSKPVDIKITFDFSSHIALIEIKWLGKSIEKLGQRRFNQTMTDADAIRGAGQLANYLELHKPYSSSQVTKGYLVVFDARRWQTNTFTTDINRANGYYYEHNEVTYTPIYHQTRNDFAKPFRFFMEPKVTI